MSSIAQHVTIRLVTDRPMLTEVAHRRAAARATLRHGETCGLVLFVYADTHAHVLLAGVGRREAMEFARRLELSLWRSLGLGPFEAARVRPVDDQWHMARAGRYILGQREHHKLTSDPFMEASNVPDLLGLREVGAYTRRAVQTWLPRVGRDALVATLPRDPAAPGELDFRLLAEAAAAAAAIASTASRSAGAQAARRAAMEVGSGFADTALAQLLSVHPRSLRRLRPVPPSEKLVRCIRAQLALRSCMQGNARSSASPASSQSGWA